MAAIYFLSIPEERGMDSTNGCIASIYLFIYKLIFGQKDVELEVKQMQERNVAGVLEWKPWGSNRWTKRIVLPLPKRKKELNQLDVLFIINRIKGTVYFPKKINYRWKMKFVYRDIPYFIEVDKEGTVRFGSDHETFGKFELNRVTG